MGNTLWEFPTSTSTMSHVNGIAQFHRVRLNSDLAAQILNTVMQTTQIKRHTKIKANEKEQQTITKNAVSSWLASFLCRFPVFSLLRNGLFGLTEYFGLFESVSLLFLDHNNQQPAITSGSGLNDYIIGNGNYTLLGTPKHSNVLSPQVFWVDHGGSDGIRRGESE